MAIEGAQCLLRCLKAVFSAAAAIQEIDAELASFWKGELWLHTQPMSTHPQIATSTACNPHHTPRPSESDPNHNVSGLWVVLFRPSPPQLSEGLLTFLGPREGVARPANS